MSERTIISIDEDKCIGCEQCVNSCPQGALAMVEGKARLVAEPLCDGLGVCIGDCPVGAIQFQRASTGPPVGPSAPGGCPGAMARELAPARDKRQPSGDQQATPSELGNWPIQLRLINPANPAFRNADLLLAASCSAFALGAFHSLLLRERPLIIACPKLDDLSGAVEKLASLFGQAQPRRVTVARMQVPCCGELTRLALEAWRNSGTDLALEEVVIGLDGDLLGTPKSLTPVSTHR